MNYEFNSSDELFVIITEINRNYYWRCSENIVFLEEIYNKNRICYAISLRDAYSHLVKIFDYPDVISNKNQINEQLIKYSGHLERLAIDTINRIYNYYLNQLKIFIGNKKELSSIKTQIALKVKDLRIINNIPFEEKYLGYESIILMIENIYKKHSNN